MDKNSFRSGRQVFSRQFMNNYRKEIWALVQLIRRIEPVPNVSHLYCLNVGLFHPVSDRWSAKTEAFSRTFHT